MSKETTGGAVVAQALAKLGVRDVFALHCGRLDALLVACPDEGIRTAGPGSTNLPVRTVE